MMVDLRRSRQEGLAPSTAHTEACNLRPASPLLLPTYTPTHVYPRAHTHTHIDTRTHAPTADTLTWEGKQGL